MNQCARSANDIAREIAARLADEELLSSIAGDPDHVDVRNGRRFSPWSDASLSEGFAGVSLLFAEMADARDAAIVRHEMLKRASASLRPLQPHGLYAGIPSVYFAATARRGCDPTDYSRLSASLEPLLHARVMELCGQERRRQTERRPGIPMDVFDLMMGLTGYGIAMLADPARNEEPLTEIVEVLAGLAQPVEYLGERLPGWWAPHGPGFVEDDEWAITGHVNCGIAHGVAGPLAFLAIAFAKGFSSQASRSAIDVLGEWFAAHVDNTATGFARWPDILIPSASGRRTRASSLMNDRPGWCYGVGTARALQLAAQVAAKPQWAEMAVAVCKDAVKQCQGQTPFVDSSLCHGWAGLLQTCIRVNDDAQDVDLRQGIEWLASELVTRASEEAPLLYVYASTVLEVAPNRIGFLEGAAGIALALLSFSSSAPVRSRWDSALALA